MRKVLYNKRKAKQDGMKWSRFTEEQIIGVRVDAARSLASLGDPRAFPALVHVLLPDDNPSVRRDGICLLKRLTGLTFGFDPDAPATSRNEAIKEWRQWLRESFPGTSAPRSP